MRVVVSDGLLLAKVHYLEQLEILWNTVILVWSSLGVVGDGQVTISVDHCKIYKNPGLIMLHVLHMSDMCFSRWLHYQITNSL